jgi:hypothetical protein
MTPDTSLSAEDHFTKTVLAGMAGHERSQQKLIGPSGLGTPCPRKLAYQLAQADDRQKPETQHRQTVGVGYHAWAEDKFIRYGEGLWLTERKVMVGKLVTTNGETEIWGTADLFHVPSGTVVDIKVPGPGSIKEKKTHGPGQTYRVQGQLYGAGYENEGFAVNAVAVVAMPAAGEFRERLWFEEPYNPAVAQAALNRASRVLQAVEDDGLPATLERLKTVDDFCRRCPFATPAPGRPTCPTANPTVTATTVAGLLKRPARSA